MAKQTTDTQAQFNAIKNDILAGDIKPVYLLFGKEHYYIDALCSLLMEKVLPPEERDFGQIVYFGADVTAAQVVGTARQFPMMVSRQLVVVKEAQMMRKVEETGQYFEGIMPTTVLVICYKTNNDPTKSGKTIDKRTSFYKQAQKTGVVFESNQLQDYKVTGWIENHFRERGLKITPDGAALLAEYCGVDISKIVLEVDKLVKTLPQGCTSITAGEIEENVGMSRDYTAFELAKMLSFKKAAECFKIVHFFSESEKRFPFVVILAALAPHFLKVLRYEALLKDGCSQNDALSQIGVNPYFANEYNTAARNYPMVKCMKVIATLKEYDLKSKSNGRGDASDGELLQELTAKILAC